MNDWPALPLGTWQGTCDTLHMYAQIVGKVRLALAPAEREWAHVPLYVTTRGLGTSPIPYERRTFSVDFDFIDHVLKIATSDGALRSIPLLPARSVASFYASFMDALRDCGITVHISTLPAEVAAPIRFTDDETHASYDADAVHRFWTILVQVDTVLKQHRAPFERRHTLVQFFWGTFDIAYARFSGRPATPPHGDSIVRHAMDAEEICAGFWPGDERFPEPAFWCYAFPKPDGLETAGVGPAAASWNAAMGEFVLRYDDVRTSADPRAAVLEFLDSTYTACAALGKWDEVS